MMRGLIALGIIAFMAGLGVVVGNRMSSEAMAVVVGVVCGVLAGIPTAVLMLVIVRAQQRRDGTPLRYVPDYERAAAQYPPVIVVNPGGGHQQLLQQDAGAVDGTWRSPETHRREFRIIGEDE